MDDALPQDPAFRERYLAAIAAANRRRWEDAGLVLGYPSGGVYAGGVEHVLVCLDGVEVYGDHAGDHVFVDGARFSVDDAVNMFAKPLLALQLARSKEGKIPR